MSEFVDDLERRITAGILEQLGVSPETAALVAAEVTMAVVKDWQGERPYIAAASVAHKETSARNRNIIRDWKAGERVALLARRYGLSRKRIYQIVYG